MQLLWLSLAFLGGLVLGDWLKWSWQLWLVLFLVSIPLAYLLRRRSFFIFHPSSYIFVFLPAALFGGALRWQLAQPVLSPQTLAWYNGRGSLAITGVIVAPPDQRSTFTYLRIQASQIAPPGNAVLAVNSPVTGTQPVRGTLLAMVLPGGDWQYGDRVTLTGSPALPPESTEFSFKEYLARQGIYTYLSFPQVRRLESGQGNPVWAWLYGFKKHALSVVYRIFPQPESALLAGILLGDDSRISPSLQQAFQATGTAHIIAISG
jgi:competence protein ComEC